MLLRFIPIFILSIASLSEARCGELSLHEAHMLQRKSSSALRASDVALRAAQRSVSAAKGLRSPQIEVVGGYTLFDRDLGVDIGVPITAQQSLKIDLVLQERYFGGVGATMVMPIWMGGKISAAVAIAKDESRAVELKSEELSSRLFTTLVERYFAVILSRELVALRQEAVAVMRLHLDNTRRRVEEGVVPSVDMLYVEARVADAERDLTIAQSDLVIATDALSSTIYSEIDSLSTPLFEVDMPKSVDSFVSSLDEHSPIIRGVELRESIAQEGVRLARAELMPEVTAISGAVIYSHNLTPIIPRWAVGVGLRWRLFDGVRSINRLRSAQYQLQSLEALCEDAHSELSLLVRKCYNDLRKACSRYDGYHATLSYMHEYTRMQRLSFSEGVATAVELADAQLGLFATQVEQLRALYEVDVALARLLEAAGQSDRFFEFME